MEIQTLTAICKLDVDTKTATDIDNLMLMFAATCNYVNASVNPRYTGATKIQKLIYKDAKEKSGMQANHVIQACIRVAGNRKVNRVKEYKPGSVPFDARTMAIRWHNKTVSLTLLGKRVKGIPLVINKYANYLLLDRENQEITSAVLVRSGKAYYLHIQVDHFVLQPNASSQYLGVDLGRRDIAYTSDDQSWSGKEIETVRVKHSKVRAELQQKASKGTRSSRRRCRQLQKRLAGKEHRYQKWLNHNISNAILLNAKRTNRYVVLEDLEGIRERLNEKPNKREQRFLSNSWSFYQLKQFICYKAKIYGVLVILVDPRYTSQTCHNCLHIHPEKGKSYRSGKNFHCKHCNWKGDADANGARVIALLGENVNRPCGSEFISCQIPVVSSSRASESLH
ncbi:IS200/IS605 family element transposase accessory protein TnpB [Scytonema sp. UIC 10036]|uniref:RNA-guided endonuclease InsQ/TnpB family protein n=1 Tax=Scytonema sp. UIC 10036 TaxID=2304196 RepID=UPI0012DA5692|nr:RNA-guided endonuclease TnpB family protein [Scytonema sp. UIC 10036]MUG98868.1 IS200/IS605 family element transposase accessory protein TnpB [Scytonema sp. UIC 10036]